MDNEKFKKYLKENWHDYIKNACRSCHTRTKLILIHKHTKTEYPFCDNCVEKGFYNKELFYIKGEVNMKGLDLILAEVKKFHETFKHPVSEKPTMLDKQRLYKRNNWVIDELIESEQADDVVGQADGMIDAIYFLMGSLVEMGVKPQAIFEIVQEANMAKVFPDGKPHFNEVGKVIKPQGWVAPEPKIEAEIKRQGE